MGNYKFLESCYFDGILIENFYYAKSNFTLTKLHTELIYYLALCMLLAIKQRVLKITGWVKSNETCLARQRYKEICGEDAPVPAFIIAQCQSESRHKRSAAEVGTLVLTFTFSEEIPFDCDFDCLDRISRTLRFQLYEVQWRVANGLALSATNLETSELVNFTLQGELQADNDDPQITCTSGQILSEDQEVCGKNWQTKYIEHLLLDVWAHQ